jgi:release factor glutamine methyltransferase
VRQESVVQRLRAAGCVFAEDEARLLIEAAGSAGELVGLVDRRAAGEPLEHVLGWAEFCGRRIAVDPGVFVPRRRTEFLVDAALRFVRPGIRVVDLCCGSGAVGAALLAAVRGIELHAADVDPAAVACARRNLTAAGGRVYAGDLFDALPSELAGRIDVVTANVPYVPTDAVALMPPEARDHEARLALDGGPDGLAVLRRVASAAPGWLTAGGHLLVETSDQQAPPAVDAFVRSGLGAEVARSEEHDATVIIGSLPPQ